MLPQRTLLVLLAIASILHGCSGRNQSGDIPTAADLRPYDFHGHTTAKLHRLCRQASQQKGQAAAQMHLLCGRTLLDWYLSATLREDRRSLEALSRLLDQLEVPHRAQNPPGTRMLSAIASRLAQAAKEASGHSLSHLATAGQRLVTLQRDQSLKWSFDYLDGIAKAAADGQPWEIQARVIIAGAAMDGLRTLAKAPRHQRRQLIIQGLGFACPAEAEAARDLAPLTPRRPSCPLACPSLAGLVYRLPPHRRKALIAAQCPLSHLGIAQRQHGVYLSPDNLLITRAISFQLHNLQRLLASRRHPLVATVEGALKQLKNRLSALRVPLFLPDLSPGEPIHLQVPLCASAEEPLQSGVYLVIDETRFYAGPVPVLGVREWQVAFLDLLEGYRFPGRPVYVADRAALTVTLARLHVAWQRASRGEIKAPEDRLAVYADRRLTAGRLNDLLDLLVRVGIRHVELVLRNSQGRLRAVPVRLAAEQRSEGPPWSVPKSAKHDPTTAPLQLTLSGRRLHLTASTGTLAKTPVRIPANDLAGLREALEKTRREYRQASGVRVHLKGETTYLEVARLLHHLRRNSSGRVLYETLIL